MCGRADLGRGVAFSEGGGGAAVGVVIVENVGSRRCVVEDVPQVTLLSAAGKALAVVQAPANAAGRRVVLLPGERAQASIAWSNYCGHGQATSGRLIWHGVSVPLRPAANGWITRARCDDPRAASTVSVGPFQRRSR